MASDEGKANPPDESYGAARSLSEALPQRPSLVERVKALAQALEGSDVSELDLTEDGARILIRRQLEAPLVKPRGRERGGASGRQTLAESAPAPVTELGIAIVAPLTGVFYASASPSAAPYAQVGDTVQAGQVVCIVEAMKVFNDIKSEISGTVSSVVAKNGNLVQKGEALIRVKPI
jgi:acetyl-CoA carboxylase biotin carboxyl carrier protein